MYIALQCQNCGREHPLRSMSKDVLHALLLYSMVADMHNLATNRLSNREWTQIILAELALRSKS
jgi:hypothetical protein